MFFFFLHPAVLWLTAGLIFDEGRGDEPKASRSDCVMQETPKSSAIVTPPCPALLFMERRIRFCTAWMAVSPRTDAQWSQEKQRLLCPSHHDHLCASKCPFCCPQTTAQLNLTNVAKYLSRDPRSWNTFKKKEVKWIIKLPDSDFYQVAQIGTATWTCKWKIWCTHLDSASLKWGNQQDIVQMSASAYAVKADALLKTDIQYFEFQNSI